MPIVQIMWALISALFLIIGQYPVELNKSEGVIFEGTIVEIEFIPRTLISEYKYTTCDGLEVVFQNYKCEYYRITLQDNFRIYILDCDKNTNNRWMSMHCLVGDKARIYRVKQYPYILFVPLIIRS